jgi:malate permease and related proteins
MPTFFTALTTIVLPILLVAAVGYILRRTQLVTDSRPLARASLYFFSPALVLNSIARSKLSSNDFVTLLVYSFVVTAAVGLLAYVLGRLLNFDRLLLSGFLLGVMFVNAGNMGLPFNQFAFGQPGLVRAAVYFVGSAILIQTLAIFIACRGRSSIGQSIAAVFKMPLVYAAALGILLNHLNWTLPDALSRALDLAAAAAVPVMLVILGLELARVRLTSVPLPVLLAALLKLIVTPAIALVLAEVMNLRDLTRAVAVLQASMPTAVNSSIIAIEFDARPDFVTSVVLVSTLGSMITLVLLLLLMGYSG